MSAKWTLASSATAGDRLLNVGHAARQLSTGDTVMLVYDPAAADPNKVTLQLVTAASGHTATQLIATISSDNFALNGVPQSLALDVDDDDNIYVVGSDNSGGETDQIGAQCFVKGTGLTWTTQPYVANSGNSATNGATFGGFATVWSNTGGGAGGGGHLLVIINDLASGNTYALTLDAGKLQTGSMSVPNAIKNPAFLGGASVATVAGSNLDIATEGMGGTTGMAAIAGDGTHVVTGSWGLTSAGQITSGGALVDTRLAGTMTAATKVRIAWYAPSAYLTFFRSSAHAGQLTVVSYSPTAYLGTVDSGVVSNFPAPSASLSWAVIAAPASTLTVWIFGWSSLTATTMLRLPIVVLASGVPTVGTVATDDTTLGTAGTSIRADPNPVDTLHADYQIFQSTTPFGLLGDFSSLNAAPYAPLLQSPANGVVSAMAPGGVLSWLFSSPVVGDSQTRRALRIQVNGGAYQWWRISDSSWQPSETWSATVNQSTTFPAGAFVAGNVITWSVRTTGSGASPQDGPYAAAFTFTVANPAPATPTLTVAYNPVTNLTTLTLHSTDATGPTGSIEFSDDGGTTWTFLRGATALVINPGTATVTDITTPPQPTTRMYRARSWTGAPQSFSLYATGTANAVLSAYWLVDPVGGTQVIIQIKDGSYHSQPKKQATAHYPLGGTFAKIEVGEVFGREGSFTILSRSETEDAALTALLAQPSILLWQRPNAGNLFLFVLVDAAVDMTITPTALTSYREHAVSFIETAAP